MNHPSFFFARRLLGEVERPLVMGIINLSSGSFYDATPDFDGALKRAKEMIRCGVDIIDVGAVATNPMINMKTDLPSQISELEQIVPFVSALSKIFNGYISIDTSDSVVMAEAVKVGANFINDQRALHEPGALEVVAKFNLPVCLMHFFRKPRLSGDSDQDLPTLFETVKCDLLADVKRCQLAGIDKENIILDPGFGGGNFGKSAQENFYLLQRLQEFVDLGFPILAGFSRKSMFGDLLGVPKSERLVASISAAVIAMGKGATILRVHDVKETIEAAKVFSAVNSHRLDSGSLDCASRAK